LFRALGSQDPPRKIEVEGVVFRRVEIFKHDSWAATALYESDDRRIVCKFNRVEAIGGMPCAWLGRALARREARMYRRLQDVPGIPRPVAGRIRVSGQIQRHAVGHDYVPGHPLRWHDSVGDEFFPRLRKSLQSVHRRGMAYVDLNKRENILQGDDGQPYLIDFQISVRLPRLWPLSALLRVLQNADCYHLEKHARAFRPDLFRAGPAARSGSRQPLAIRWHRALFRPLRQLRRRILVWLGVRAGSGYAHSEVGVELALRSAPAGNEPLLRLHATLLSDEYFQARGGTFETYAAGMFRDVFGRAAASQNEARMVRCLAETRSRHHVAAGLLRSPPAYLLSGKLSASWVRRVHARILEELGPVASPPPPGFERSPASAAA
jgi:hypothetical protein